MKTEHFYVGFADDNQNRGQIYLNHTLFANFFKCPSDWGTSAGKFQLNRDWIAGKIKYDGKNIFESIPEMLSFLENWYRIKTSKCISEFNVGSYKIRIYKYIDGLFFGSLELNSNVLESTQKWESDIDVVFEINKLIKKWDSIQGR